MKWGLVDLMISEASSEPAGVFLYHFISKEPTMYHFTKSSNILEVKPILRRYMSPFCQMWPKGLPDDKYKAIITDCTGPKTHLYQMIFMFQTTKLSRNLRFLMKSFYLDQHWNLLSLNLSLYFEFPHLFFLLL